MAKKGKKWDKEKYKNLKTLRQKRSFFGKLKREFYNFSKALF